MLPDTGERYLSTPLFADIPADMTDEELEIARSTPSYRFDVRAGAGAARAPTRTARPRRRRGRELRRTRDRRREQPVVMFALEWCEFCWSVRKHVRRVQDRRTARSISTRSSTSRTTAADRSARRSRAHDAATTIPQIFVGGELIGGCTETLQAFKDGRCRPCSGARA